MVGCPLSNCETSAAVPKAPVCPITLRNYQVTGEADWRLPESSWASKLLACGGSIHGDDAEARDCQPRRNCKDRRGRSGDACDTEVTVPKPVAECSIGTAAAGRHPSITVRNIEPMIPGTTPPEEDSENCPFHRSYRRNRVLAVDRREQRVKFWLGG